MSVYLKMYEDYLVNTKNACVNTVSSYINDISSFIAYFNCDDKGILSIESQDISSYISSMINTGKCTSTLSRKLAAIRSFYKYLNNISLIEINPVCEIYIEKSEKKLPSVITVEEVDMLLNEPSEGEPKGIRDKAMLAILYATGLKTSEIISLNLEDVNFSLGQLKCKRGRVLRSIPIYSEAMRVLHRYVEEVRETIVKSSKENALFVNIGGSRLTRQGFWKIVKCYSSRVGIDNITPHTLRHSFAVHLLSNGAELKDVQKMLGHSDISSTQVYSKILEDSLCAAYKKYHPKG